VVENYGVGAGSIEDSAAPAFAADAQNSPEADTDAAVVRFVREVIEQAIEDVATDIHFEPQEGQLRIRYRVDGLLVPVPVPENLLRYQDAIISRLKIMARLNISEKRLPQDGRINYRAGETVLDIRVSTIPTIYAESVSLRLLNQKREAYTMERLGMDDAERAHVLESIRLATADPEHRVPHLAFQPDSMSSLPILPMSEVETGYYLRLRVEDKPGVLADVTRILADQQISLAALLQREPEEGEG